MCANSKVPKHNHSRFITRAPLTFIVVVVVVVALESVVMINQFRGRRGGGGEGSWIWEARFHNSDLVGYNFTIKVMVW